MGFSLNWKFAAKKVWKALPRHVRELPLRGLCVMRVGRGHSCPVPRGEASTDNPVYILGNFLSGGGISRSAKLYAEQLKDKKDKFICVDTTKEMMQCVHTPEAAGHVSNVAEFLQRTEAATVIIHLNPPQFLWLLCRLGRKTMQNKHIIAYWAWELEEIPPLWKFALRYVDAVEVPSTLTQRAVATNTPKPVRVCPHVVPAPNKTKSEFCANGKLHCLFIFDMPSLYSRKNPEAVIAAFVKAFTPDEACLTIKVGQPNAHAANWERLRQVAGRHRHVTLRSDWLDEAGLENLFLAHDVYISLHRSEGYGLTIREAMLYNLYVVATGWSGNMDFMHGERAFPVPYTLVPVNKNDRTFGTIRGARWAEPDIDKTAQILKQIYHTLLPRQANMAKAAS